MNIIANKILLNRKQSVAIVDNGEIFANEHIILAILAEISQLGYTLDKPVLDVLKSFNKKELKEFKDFLISELKVMVGANVRYVPLFKSFPNDIPDTNELYVKKIIGYFENLFKIIPEEYKVLSCGHVVCTKMFSIDNYSGCPICEKQDLELMKGHDDSHKDLEGIKQFKIITLTNENSVFNIFKNLLSSKTSISESDLSDISDIISYYGESIVDHLPESINQKEIVVFLVNELLTKLNADINSISKYFKTATDVLRLATQFSGGDVSLAANTKFKLKNKERKIVMSLLNNIQNADSDMIRHREKWLRLGEVLHIGAYKNKYPVAFSSFNSLRNDAKNINTFNRAVEKLLIDAKSRKNNNSQIDSLTKVLISRPGDFARRLDHVIRTAKNPTDAIKDFESIVSKVPTPILLVLSKHIKSRNKLKDFRAFIPKGKMSKIKLIEGDNRKLIIDKYIKKVSDIIYLELNSRFQKLPPLGKNIRIKREELEGQIVPFSQRSASKSLLNITRGSKMKVNKDIPFIRLFTYWKAPVDIDLGITMLDEKFNSLGVVSYYNLSSYGKTVHSGDIRDGRHGAVEFIDIDVDAFKKLGVRYVSVNIYSYSGEKFSTIDCFAGYMEREQPDGRQFDATTVKNKFNISSESTSCIPMVFDLLKNEVVWLDIVTKQDSLHSNYHNTQTATINAIRAGLDLINTRPTLFDLVNLHANARSESVTYVQIDGEYYDHTFDLSILMDLDKIMSEYLS